MVYVAALLQIKKVFGMSYIIGWFKFSVWLTVPGSFLLQLSINAAASHHLLQYQVQRNPIILLMDSKCCMGMVEGDASKMWSVSFVVFSFYVCLVYAYRSEINDFYFLYEKLLGSLTEDEKEVLQALCALSRILPIKERIQDDKDRAISENHQDNIATPTAHSEGEFLLLSCSTALSIDSYVCIPFDLTFVGWNSSIISYSTAMKEDKNLLQQSTTNGIKSPSFCLEKTLEKPMKNEHAISKQPDTKSGMQTIDSGLSIAPDSGSHITPLSENVHPENIPGNLKSFLSRSGVLPRHCTENR